jgi:hypothetical protein
MLTTLLDTPSFTIEYDPAQRCLCTTWRGTHDAVAALVHCNSLLDYVRHTRAHWLLNDSSQSLDGWQEVAQWLGLNYFPRLAEAGIRAVAWVNARDWPARAHMAEMLRLVERPLLDTFDDVEGAYGWLQTLPAPSHPCPPAPHPAP